MSTSATGSLYDTEMLRLLEDYIYYERDIEVESHFLHVETDDDEVDVEYYFFDDEFLKSPEALDRLPSPNRRLGRDGYEDRDSDHGDPYAVLIRLLQGSE